MDKTPDQRPRKLVTLVMVHEPPRILLGMKNAGFGAGWWNGFGGKVEQGETIEEAAHRELREEVGIGVMVLENAGLLFFDIEGDPRLHECHIFRASGVIGEPVETEEMVTPQWFQDDAIPYDKMWKGDDQWIPLFIKGTPFEGTLTFDKGHNLIQADVTPQT